MSQSKVNQQEKIFSALDWAAVKYFVKAAWLVRISVNPNLSKEEYEDIQSLERNFGLTHEERRAL